MNILCDPPEIEDPVFNNYSFPLDTFQKNAIVSINQNHNVLVTAATGSGKSLVAEYAIETGVKKGKKVIYTSPIKSLSNQKFYEFKRKFPQMDVGILTGDIKFNPTADCIIMTTEILRNLLYNKNIKIAELDVEIDVYNEVESVVFDEVHYINDRDRGSVWEECIMLLPKEINLVMLSATIDKAERFAYWIYQIKDKPIDLIPNDKRVIPLNHYYYLMNKVDLKQDDDIYEKEDKHCNRLVEILDEKNHFNGENYDLLTRIYKKYKIYNQRNGKKLLNDVVEYLEKKDLVPAIFFVFSRKKCELYAKYIEKNMNNHEEYGAIKKIVNYYIHQLDNPKDYINMEQYINIMKYLEKGICIHHSGLIPVFKEIIEILFSKNLIKVLFATETFAVGVNMPTKTVLFTSLSKYDSYQNNFRTLLTHEYLQMSGRAGRRGLDTKGIVIHLPNLTEPLDKSSMQMMMTGRTQQIISKFGLNYQFILKMILTEQTNLMNFIETSLMNKDINETKQGIQYQLDSIKLIDITFDKDLMDEYYDLLNPDPFFKISNKQIKKNRARVQAIEKVQNFREDYSIYIKYKKGQEQRIELEKELDYYQNMINHDIMKIVSYLRKYDYLTNDSMEPESVSVKGIIASQINECNPILFTEILTNNLFDGLSVPELAAILSMFRESKDEDEIEESNHLGVHINDRIQEIGKLVDELDKNEYYMGLSINSEWNLNKGDLVVAYDWASGKTVKELDMTVYEGNFIKDMIKINNLAENVGKMAGILGKNDLVQKASELQTVMMRDIVNVESLYIKID